MRANIQPATYDETIRFNITLIDTTGADHTLHSPITLAAPPELIDEILPIVNQAEAAPVGGGLRSWP